MNNFANDEDKSFFDELMDLNYAVYDHVKDFKENLADLDIGEESNVYLGLRVEDEVPVIDIRGDGEDSTYIDAYHLMGITAGNAIPAYRFWAQTFGEEFENLNTLSEQDLEGYKAK